ncbi:MAG: AsmA family protein [Terriglobia bacterium]
MSKRTKILLAIVVFLIVALVVIVVVVPRIFDVDRYRPQVAALIETQLGRRATIGHLAFTVLPRLSIRADDFTLKNPAGFPQGDFVKAHRIYAVVDAASFWRHQVVIKSLDLEGPTISLLSGRKGKWNSGDPPSPAEPAPDPPGDKPLFTLGTISNVRISKGNLSIANLLPSGEAGPAFVEADGVTSQLRRFDLNVLTESAQAQNPQSSLVTEGTFEVNALHVSNLSMTKVKSNLRLFSDQVLLDGLEFRCYDGGGGGNLAFAFGSRSTRYRTQANLSGVNVAKLLDAFPDVRGKMTGVLEGHVALDGEVSHSPDPLDSMGGAGHLTVRAGRFPTLQLNANLLQLFRVAKMGPASGDPYSFSSIAMDFTIANNKIQTTKGNIVGNGVEINATGSIGFAGNGSLDYQGVARLATSDNSLTSILGGLTGATLKGGKMILPFEIKGTFKNPQFTLKPSGSQNPGRNP